MRTLSILIADDYAVVRQGLRSLLEAQSCWKVVAEADNGREAVRKAVELRPDIVILDITMPEMNGLDAARLILKAAPQTKVLVLTVHDAEEVIEMALQAGAQGYVLKSEGAEELVAAVNALKQNKTFFSSAASKVVLRRLRGETTVKSQPVLTVREREVVQLLAEGKSNKQVAATLSISTRTAENHRASIMSKLGLSSLSELVRYAIRNKMVEP